MIARQLPLAGVAAAILLTASPPASAITFGQPDGSAHPQVGSLVVRIPDAGIFQWCSGTLVAPQVFLTASHCTQPIDAILEAYPGSEFLVTFDPVIDTSGTFYSGTAHTNPAYGSSAENDPHDIAVFVLDAAPPIAPAALPTAGLLDQLAASQVLRQTEFTAVGYGTVRDSLKKGWQGIADNASRQSADQRFWSLTPAWLDLSMLPSGANHSGGTCYGDSGGPHFVWIDGAETDIVAGITITGDAQCKALDRDYRVDTPAAREFLATFVTLP